MLIFIPFATTIFLPLAFLAQKTIQETMKKLILVDWSGYLFRAYYGLPELSNAQWEKVHAIYGFLRMLFKVFHEKPDYFVLAWDAPHKTVRHEQYTEYKANRPTQPDDFKFQIWLTKNIVDQLNINYQEIPGYEADDIIATLARRWSQDGLQVTIMTSDKDLKSLLDENICCVDPMKWLTHTAKSFVDERGFEPIHMIDYLALIGDASDNIPGVKGIGPKGAIGLIQKYHTLENIYAHIDEISKALQEKLVINQEIAHQSKTLIQLLDVPWLVTTPRENFLMKPSFEHYRKILIDQYQFNSMEKNIKALQDMYEKPQQMGLFG